MVDREKMITKIQNLFDLANNNPNENEAIAAALKAQELMAKFDIELADVNSSNNDQEILHEVVFVKKNTGYCIKWRFQLATLIANNFKVKTFSHNGDGVAFYGYKSDVKIAVSVFNFLFDTGNKLSCKYYYQCKAEGRKTRGVMNSYLIGFMRGLRDVLEKQCTELMIVTPEEVNNKFNELTENWKTINTNITSSKDVDAYDTGRSDGKSVAESRSLEVA